MKLIILKKRVLIAALAITLVTLSGAVFTVDTAVSIMAGKMHVPICNVETEEKNIALTFDLTENSNADSIMNALEGEKATFFVSEEFFERNPQKTVELAEKEYDIQLLENNLKGKTKEEIYDRIAERIERTSFILNKNCDKVRFNLNFYDNNSVKAIYSLGLYPVQWSADSTAEYFSCGDIVRVEEKSNIAGLVKMLKGEGYTFVTVSELLYKENYKIGLSGEQISN